MSNRFMNFIKKIFDKKIDDSVHKQFIRFGKGDYCKRAVLTLWKAKNIKVKGSFEFANDFVLFVAGLNGSKDVSFEGDVWSKEEIEGLQGEKKTGKWVYKIKDFSSESVNRIKDKAYYFLLNVNSPEIKLKIKSKLPKPGKDEAKIDDKFCQLELDTKYSKEVLEDFFWDLPECKKARIVHNYFIKEIVFPNTEEKDFAKIREGAKRKGTLVREAEIDGKTMKKEIEFCA